MLYNFNAGPAVLPLEVVEGIARATLQFGEKKLSILELSHRDEEINNFIQESRQLVRELLDLPEQYEVLFLSGGSTTQFALIPMNYLPSNGVAGYIDTGTWSTKAIDAALCYGDVDVAATSEEDGFTHIPKDFRFDPEWEYFYCCSNNTIWGTQMQRYPETDVPIICDMCSDIFSRKIDASKFSLIFASAQKNLGPAGTTIVILDKTKLGKVKRAIPDILNYQKHIDKASVLNTPPVISIYGCYLMLKWLKKKGIDKLEKENREKAGLLYQEIDANPLFKGRAAKEDRSIMNVCFDIIDEKLEKSFMTFSENYDIFGIKGHRSVGGFRASLYNAMPKEGSERLVKAMQDFAWRFG